MGVVCIGMKSVAQIDQWTPSLPLLRVPGRVGPKVILKILDVCSGCGSVNSAAAAEARERFGVEGVEVFSLDGKPGTGATRVADVLTYDWEQDEDLTRFMKDEEDGATYIRYAHASPPCGPYSSMASRYLGALEQRDLRWGDSVVQRCLDLIAYYDPHLWTIESRGPPGLDSRPYMSSIESHRATVNYCRYGWGRWKATSMWTNAGSWRPEPRCSSHMSNCCDHFREHGMHMDKVQEANKNSSDFAALPPQLVRAWMRAGLTELLPPILEAGGSEVGAPQPIVLD